MPIDEKRALKVFLCHASGDKPHVRDLYKRLIREGIDAWLDQEKLLPGQDWRVEIPRAVQEADVVVICLSNKSITKEGYIQKEIKFALDSAEEKPDGTIFLIPARIEDCPVPEKLSRWQWVDLFEENGYLKLLRSLKLRADKAGASVTPSSYEDEDGESERRLDQYYTEGLAAFYTEDWKRACQRFQAILSERPNYKNALEKLEEAEQRRDLANLYIQATSVYQAQNWEAAIATLNELLKKSPDYKDAAQLLKNAKKQEQLGELYFEAKKLHDGKKWQAVLRVFEQIHALEPNHPDPDGLLPSAQEEAAEIKRLADLSELYSRALHEMELGEWQNARTLLEQVHKSQTGFLETERLLRKVEDEIAKVEEQNQRNNQVNVLYEQAHGLLRSKKWRKALDKMEEIQQLEDHFLDKDEISEKARTELAREEREAQRQNELAAIYAEAVRLLKEEKYQEALDKWQEVKAVDPKYPDRQWVQRTARKRLSGSTKPSQNKQRFVTSRSLWIGIVGLLMIGTIVVGTVLSDRESQTNLPPSASAPTKTAIAILTLSATAVPTTSSYSDPTMYDDFNNVSYNGSYNKSLWYVSSNANKFVVSQNDGKISLSVNDQSEVSLNRRIPEFISPTFFEAKLYLDPKTTNHDTALWIEINNDIGYSICEISRTGDYAQQISCTSEYYGKKVDAKLSLSGILPGWHILRFEIDPETMIISYVIDGRQVGYFDPAESIPDHLNDFKQLTFWFHIVLNNYGYSDAPVGYIDYVRMGAIEDDPLIALALSPTPITAYVWNFDNGAEAWDQEFSDLTRPLTRDGLLTFMTEDGNPYIVSPGSLQISSALTPIITVRMRYSTRGSYFGAIYFVTNKDSSWDDRKKKVFSLRDSKAMETYQIDMLTTSTWRDVITQIRLDPQEKTVGGVEIQIDYISVHSP